MASSNASRSAPPATGLGRRLQQQVAIKPSVAQQLRALYGQLLAGERQALEFMRTGGRFWQRVAKASGKPIALLRKPKRHEARPFLFDESLSPDYWPDTLGWFKNEALVFEAWRTAEMKRMEAAAARTTTSTL